MLRAFSTLTWQQSILLGLLTVTIPLWIAELVTRWKEKLWSTTRFTDAQYRDFLQRAARERIAQRNPGRAVDDGLLKWIVTRQLQNNPR